MKSTLSVVALVLMALITSVQPAQADWLDWMQEWSGPGPFHEDHVPLNATLCFKPYNDKDESVQYRNPCYFVNFRRFVSNDDDNFPVTVKANFLDIGVTFRLRRSILVGFGAGFMRAKGNKTVNRLTFTAPRVDVKPALLVAEIICAFKCRDNRVPNSLVETMDKKEFWSNRVLHVFKFYEQGNVIAMPLSGDLLGVPGTKYDRKAEYVVSRGFFIDLGELLPRLNGTR